MNFKLRTTFNILLLSALALFQISAYATPIIQSTSGLTNPDELIDFSEAGTINGPVTNQFAGLGVTFSPDLSFFASVSGRPNFSGPALLKFANTRPVLVMDFSFDVAAVSFAFTTNSLTSTFESLLDGVVVESFTSASAQPVNSSSNNFFGFTDSRFDQIRITGPTFALDNLSLTAAAEVPSPAPLALLLSGLGLLFIRRFR